MRSFATTTLCLSLASIVDARVPAEASGPQKSFKWLRDLFHKRQEQNCYYDSYTNLVYNSTEGETFCQSFMNYTTTTVYVDFTPRTTLNTIVTTITATATNNVFTTPVVTVTVTPAAAVENEKREAEAMRALPGASRNALFQRFKQRLVAAENSTISEDTISASFSSACACAAYGGPTERSTFTQPTSTVTVAGFAQTAVTTTITRAAAPTTTTVSPVSGVPNTSSPSAPAASDTTSAASATASPASDVPSVSSSSTPAVPDTTSASGTAPTPTAVAFACPKDDNTEVSNMVGNARYDYLISCDSNVEGFQIFAASYSTFAQCAAACSSVDEQFSSAICQGVIYSEEVDAEGNNCFVKSNATNIVSATGLHAAQLQRIALGITNSTVDGTTTNVVFNTAAPTASSAMSSMISSALANSTTSIPLITPGPVATFFSTDSVAGSTFSTGSGYTSAWTISGTWYYSVASSWSLIWSNAATVYQSISGSSGSISSTNTTTTTEQTGTNGEITVITNNTEVNYYPNSSVVTTEYLTTVTYNSARSSLGSSSTTIYIGGASGSEGGIISGVVPNPTPTVSLYTSFFNSSSVYSTEGSVSTSYFATQSVYTLTVGGNGTGNAGGAASGALPTIAPSTSATTVVGTFSSGFSTGTLISGAVSSTEAVATPAPSITVIVNGTAYTSGTLVSGIINGTAGASSTGISGTVPGFSDTGLPRGPGSESASTGTGTAPVLTGTAPSSLTSFIESIIISGAVPTGAIPSGSFNVSISSPVPSVPSNTTSILINPPFPSSSLTGSFPPFVPISTISSGFPASSGFPPFNASGLPRGSEGLSSSTLIGTASTARPTFNITSIPFPTAPTTGCTETVYLGTTTVVTTETVFGCAETCTPKAGYFPGPQSFGPPQFRETATAQ